MANYNPYSYQQGYYTQLNYPQNYPQYNYQAQPSPQQQLNMYAFVDGLEGAKAYRLNPNSTMLLMDSQNAICYRKQVDGQGRTVSFETYDLVPHKDQQAEVCEFVTKDEFHKEIEQIKALFNKED